MLTYGMSYSQQRFSPLSQINRDTVRRLVPVWSYSMNNNTGEESQPLIYDGVMYVTSQDPTFPLRGWFDCVLNTGRLPDFFSPVTGPSIATGIVNRGAAIYEGKVFRTTLDARGLSPRYNRGCRIPRRLLRPSVQPSARVRHCHLIGI